MNRLSLRSAQLMSSLLLSVCSVVAVAQVSTHITYEDNIRNSRKFSALDDNMFGDKISLQDGALSFAYTDVSVPTNSGLRVAIGRKLATRIHHNSPAFPVFGLGWELDVPYMMATYDSRDGWNAYNPSNPTAGRCTAGTFVPRERSGPWPNYHTQLIYAHMYWKGVQVNIPGAGQEQILKANASQVMPSDGKTYYGTTKSQWRIACLPSIKNGSGEGFTATLPDGTVYHFDWMVKRKAIDLVGKGGTNAQGNANEPWHLLAPLEDIYLYATKVEDRFGNTVVYEFDNTDHRRIKKILSSDGAQIDVAYNPDGRISSISAGGRNWSYNYDAGKLSKHILPDGSEWTFSASFAEMALSAPEVLGFWSNGCSMDPGYMGASAPVDPQKLRTLTVTHPSGAQGEFVLRPLYHGTNNAPGGCGLFGSQETSLWWGTWGVPAATGVMSMHTKRISGPGMAARTWSYGYAPTWSFQSQCNSGCASSSQTAVTTNDGVTRRYVYGNDYFYNHGQLLSETVEYANTVLKTTSYGYVSSNAGYPFPANAGDIAMGAGLATQYGNVLNFKHLPQNARTIVSEGVTYTRNVTAYDQFVRPTSVTKSNSLGHSRTDATAYYDHLGKWVLGQALSQTNTNTGMVESQTDYNSNALPWKTYKFGKLVNTLTYHADGTLATVYDGNNNAIALTNWKRGIPQQIQHPATPEAPSGAVESATVDDFGLISDITNTLGSKTCYAYDAAGRLASITHPSETAAGVCDISKWNRDYFEARATTAADWLPSGISVGQWRQYEGRGNYAKFTYYDAMWRPVLVQEYDTSDAANTTRYTRTEYDANGKPSFQSYPGTAANALITGTRTFYDGLDRPIRTEQHSGLGTLTTTTEYLTGLRTRVTNARGHQVTNTYMAWDEPDHEQLVLSEQPENKVVQIARHPRFGWPLALTQRKADNSLSVTRSYVYDGYAQLCKTIEPETGATVTGYDAVGNLAWSATGLTGGNYASTSDCSYVEANASGRVASRTYDARNRLTTLSFPDGRGNQAWTYEKDGLPASISVWNDSATTGQVTTAYTYNKRRLLAGESIHQNAWYTWAIGYSYDANGNLASQTYPTGLNIDYAPNALGQATKAGTYATGASYYPNGALKQFTYGNGIVHTMTQNARQLPLRVTSSGNALDFEYGYDRNANPTSILDHVTGTPTVQHRTMTYDGLDRLTTAASAMFGGSDQTHRFTYDALDNLKSWKLAGVKDYADYIYDAQNRLASIRNTGGATVVGLTYDPQGNLSNKNGQAYDFDFGNRLRNVQTKESYRYDGEGRRVQTTAATGVATTLWQYAKNGQMLFSSSWDGPNYLNHQTREYVHLAGSTVAIIDHSWPSNAVLAVKYQHTDALGSPVAVTNAAGQVIERLNYEPYGAIIGNPTRSGVGYTGHIMDGATGLTYMQQRYYDQSVGRFLSNDPVLADGNTGVQFNRYWYADGNPYKFVDPDGRAALAGAGIGAGLDLTIQVIEIAVGKRESIDVKSLAVSAITGAAGVGIAGKLGRLGQVGADVALSVAGNVAKGNEVTVLGTVADVVGGDVAKLNATRSITRSPAHKVAQRQADRLERIGSAEGARPAQRARAQAARPALNRNVAQRAAHSGIVGSGVGSTGAEHLQRRQDKPKR